MVWPKGWSRWEISCRGPPTCHSVLLPGASLRPPFPGGCCVTTTFAAIDPLNRDCPVAWASAGLLADRVKEWGLKVRTAVNTWRQLVAVFPGIYGVSLESTLMIDRSEVGQGLRSSMWQTS
jgi:hypothetical protein